VPYSPRVETLRLEVRSAAVSEAPLRYELGAGAALELLMSGRVG